MKFTESEVKQKLKTTQGNYLILFDSTLNRAYKPTTEVARQFLRLDSTRSWHDSDSTRKKFKWLWLDSN